MDHEFDLIAVESRKVSPRQHLVQIAQSSDRVVDRRYRKIGPEQQFVPDAIFLNQHQAVVKLERPIIQRRHISEDMRMLPDHSRGFTFVWMSKVSQDDPALWISDRYGIHVSRQCAIEWA